jgi:ABC-type phosphate transport system substrate-binding protein
MMAALATTFTFSAATAFAGDITGAGATFPYPLYAKWASEYKKSTNIGMNYQSIGSGGGIKQIKAKTVDFGASDKPLTPKELDEAGLFQFPTVMGGVVPVINVAGIGAGQLKLTPENTGRHFPRQSHQMERCQNCLQQCRRSTARSGDHCCTPLGRLWHHLYFHQLPLQGQC